MTADTVSILLKNVSDTVLSTIRDMSAKQRIKKPICLDSVALVLKIKVSDLTRIIDHLESEGHLTIHRNTAQQRVRKPDSVTLN